MANIDPNKKPETTGHVWDDDVQEYNNPLPQWWLWAFYFTVVFALVYWLIYPSWPIANGYLKGFNTITYTTDSGEEVTTHWNTRALLRDEMANSEPALAQKKMLNEIANTSHEDIEKDQKKLAFVESYGKGIFGDYCAACHRTGGQGIEGAYPNLIDDDWLWGSTYADITQTILKGRNGYMPGFSSTLNEKQLDDVAHYALSFSDHAVDTEKAARGKIIFHGAGGGCNACHNDDAKGNTLLGSANLTDKIWTVALVNEANDLQGKVDAVKDVVRNGIQREMPAWENRLSKNEVKVLVAYLSMLSEEKE